MQARAKLPKVQGQMCKGFQVGQLFKELFKRVSRSKIKERRSGMSGLWFVALEGKRVIEVMVKSGLFLGMADRGFIELSSVSEDWTVIQSICARQLFFIGF